jgi:hypothetical protein
MGENVNKYLLLFLLTACVSEQPAPIQSIPLDIAGSDCVRHIWKDRGKAPLAFIEGMVNVYKLNCKTPVKPVGSSDRDVVSYYGLQNTQLDLYTFLIGLGMRESSGKYCEGRDTTANNITASTAEAGMFQFSYNSISADYGTAAESRLRERYAYYKANPSACDLPTFSKGVTCKQNDSTIYGTGEGATFQKLSRNCPRFAVEYAAILVRVLRKHFGPINRKEVEIAQSCRTLLEQACGN